MLPIQKQFINYNFSKRNGGIKYIVIHDVGTASTAQNNRDYFAGGNRNASADFFVDSNNIIQIIDYHKNYSWNCGDGRGKYGIKNSNGVAIEMCLESNMQPSSKTIQNTLQLVRYLMNELNISMDRVVRHYDASRKCCPRSFSYNNWAKWKWFKKQLKKQLKTKIIKKDKESVFDMKYIVVYGNAVDQRIAENLADFLKCSTIDGKRPFDYSKIKNVICVGGAPTTNGHKAWTGYATKILTGKNRNETIDLVQKYMKSFK